MTWAEMTRTEKIVAVTAIVYFIVSYGFLVAN